MKRDVLTKSSPSFYAFLTLVLICALTFMLLMCEHILFLQQPTTHDFGIDLWTEMSVFRAIGYLTLCVTSCVLAAMSTRFKSLSDVLMILVGALAGFVCGGVMGFVGGMIYDTSVVSGLKSYHASLPNVVRAFKRDHQRLPSTTDELIPRYIDESPWVPSFCSPFNLGRHEDTWSLSTDCEFVDTSNSPHKHNYSVDRTRTRRLIYKSTTSAWHSGELSCCFRSSELELAPPKYEHIEF